MILTKWCGPPPIFFKLVGGECVAPVVRLSTGHVTETHPLPAKEDAAPTDDAPNPDGPRLPSVSLTVHAPWKILLTSDPRM